MSFDVKVDVNMAQRLWIPPSLESEEQLLYSIMLNTQLLCIIVKRFLDKSTLVSYSVVHEFQSW